MSSATLLVVTPPAVEPVLLGEAKLHLRIDTDDEDGLIIGYLHAAALYCEQIQGRAYITRTLRLELDSFPGGSGVILLPRPPTGAIVSVEYDDEDGAGQTLDAADYEADLNSEPARLRPAEGLTWPATASTFAAARITYTAGYGPDPTDIPEDLRAAVKLVLGDLYENRESVVLGLNANTTQAVEALLWPTRFYEGTNV